MGKSKSGGSKAETKSKSYKTRDSWKKYSKSANIFELDDNDEYDSWVPEYRSYNRFK